MPIVVDTSMTMTWCFEDEASPATRLVFRRIAQESAVVPTLWLYEVASALAIGQRRGRITEAGAEAFFQTLEDLPIRVAVETTLVTSRAILTLAREHRLTAYDASYLELALRERLLLATLDGDLRAAAQRAGVQLL